jgi:hypothetical protein
MLIGEGTIDGLISPATDPICQTTKTNSSGE